jgi:hypothetical protein
VQALRRKAGPLVVHVKTPTGALRVGLAGNLDGAASRRAAQGIIEQQMKNDQHAWHGVVGDRR